MKSPGRLSILIQVAALAALAVVMSQAVTFAVVFLTPEPPQRGFSIDDAAAALQGKPARTADGKTLKRRFTTSPPPAEDDRGDPLALGIAISLAQKLGAPTDRVRVTVERPPRPMFDPRPPGGAVRRDGPDTRGAMIFVRPQSSPPGEAPPHRMTSQQIEAFRRLAGPGAASVTITRSRTADGATTSETAVRQFSVLTDRLTFAPFTAAVHQADGRWAVVEPPHRLLSPWQVRTLLGMGLSMLLLAPIVWLMARRLTRPIRGFAEAAERLGANPDAEPLAPSGPAEVRVAIAAFNDMQAKLRDHIRRRTQTVAAIAHDLRTPLTRLRFRVEQAPETLRDRMVADVEEMDALIGQAMAYVRGEAQPDRRERIDLTTLAQTCAAAFADTGEPVSFTGGRPIAVQADPAALRRALTNLIGNAVKYGGAARVSTDVSDGQAVIAVEDDGPGLDEAEREAVFEPFHRLETSRNRETGGTGLGLTVARQAARAHGGDVILINRPGGGLTARLSLPAA